MKDTGSARGGIQRGFCLLLFLSTILLSAPLAKAENTRLVINPASVNFGNVAVGSTTWRRITLTNSGWSRITLIRASVSGTGYSLSSLNYPVTLGGGQSVTCAIRFSPPGPGTDSGRIAITLVTRERWRYSSNESSTATVLVSGTGVSSGQLAAAPTALSFGNVQVGGSQTLTETITNFGATPVTVSALNVTGSGFSASGLSLPSTLASGQSASLTVLYSPTSAGSGNGSLAISSDAVDAVLSVPLSGTGVTPGQLAASPASLNFGNVATGSSSTVAETLTNMGDSAITISHLSTSASGFSFAGITPPITLSAKQSVTFNVSFAPTLGGIINGDLVATSNASDPTLSVPLSGTGVAPGQLTITPASINFGNVVDGTTQVKGATLTANNGPVTVSSASVSQTEFSLSGLALPVTIPAGYSLSYSVIFAPLTTGTASANVSFSSNASNTPTSQSVSGSGTTPPPHSVALNWTASGSSNVVGYNVYRGAAFGGPYAEINSGIAATADTDSTVLSGQTYYYVVTAVDSSGVESAYSNQVIATIPSP
ncbi:MAG TPA: choice-of-anchor D domain-containing protein [Terriglobales bacterium]|nr:choice-of-anchor D domain-containing protein [Terriglobales bacterium]